MAANSAATADRAPAKLSMAMAQQATPPGARVLNDSTGDDLGRTPLDVLVPPGGTLDLVLKLPGHPDARVTVTHAEAREHPERTVDLSRRR